jgi:CHAT domain-containing protein
LPYAGREAKTISKILPNAKLLIREEASETSIKKIGGDFGILHIASHGTFNPDVPLSSGLMLAKDNQNDGMLTVGELYDLSLNADLVTLSACETALGKVAHGDDVVGFTRGFFYAGASSIISSLWQVDDWATGELMQSFYLNMKSVNKRKALRNAQLKLKKDSRSAHAFYWAAFQMTGIE